jgi:hypothetical protein
MILMDMDNDKLIKTVMLLVIIGFVFPLIYTVQKAQNDEFLTRNVYIDKEVGLNNITVNYDYNTTNINFKESIRNESIINDSLVNMNESSNPIYNSYSNVTANVECNLTNVEIGNYSAINDISTIEVYNNTVLSTSTHASYTSFESDILYSSFRINDSIVALKSLIYRGRSMSDTSHTHNLSFYTAKLLTSYNPITGEPSLSIRPDVYINSTIVTFTSTIGETLNIASNIDTVFEGSSTYNNSFFISLQTILTSFRFSYVDSTSNSVDLLNENVLPLDFAINYTFYNINLINNININSNSVLESSNFEFVINNLAISNFISITFNSSIENITFDFNINIVLYTVLWNNTIESLSVDSIILTTNSTNAFMMNSSITNGILFTVFNIKINNIYFYIESENITLNCNLNSNLILQTNFIYNISIESIIMFNNLSEVLIKVYRNNILINSLIENDVEIYPSYF